MRSLCACLAAAVLAGPLIVLVPGCGSGTAEIEKTPPNVTPGQLKAEDMPGYKDMQESLKKKGATK